MTIEKEASQRKAAGMQSDEHWAEIMALAKQYGFIAQAYSGTALLITHRVQLEEYGIRGYLRIQKMNGHCAKELGYDGCLDDNGKLQSCARCTLSRQAHSMEGA